MNFEETPPKIRSGSPGIGLLFCRSCLKLKFVMDIDWPGELPKRSYECRTYSVKFTSANSNVPGLAHVRSEGSRFSSPPSRARPGTSETERERTPAGLHHRPPPSGSCLGAAGGGSDQSSRSDQIRSEPGRTRAPGALNRFALSLAFVLLAARRPRTEAPPSAGSL